MTSGILQLAIVVFLWLVRSIAKIRVMTPGVFISSLSHLYEKYDNLSNFEVRLGERSKIQTAPALNHPCGVSGFSCVVKGADVISPKAIDSSSGYDTGTGWGEKTCHGHHQSPIDIRTSGVTPDNAVRVILTNYNRNISLQTVSFAHKTVSFKSMDSRTNPGLTINKTFGNKTIKSEFNLYNFHFHWNCTEHHFDSQRFAMELHFVHYNRQYDNFTVSTKTEGGLSVLAVLFELSPQDNEALNTLFHMMETLTSMGPKSNHSALHFSDLLPSANFTVYQYNGSLTTPTCDEVVTWNVIKERQTVSIRQISEFQKLCNYSVPMNCRRLQWQNDRKVYSVAVTMSTTDSASITGSQYVLCLISIIVMIYSSKNMLDCE